MLLIYDVKRNTKIDSMGPFKLKKYTNPNTDCYISEDTLRCHKFDEGIYKGGFPG